MGSVWVPVRLLFEQGGSIPLAKVGLGKALGKMKGGASPEAKKAPPSPKPPKSPVVGGKAKGKGKKASSDEPRTRPVKVHVSLAPREVAPPEEFARRGDDAPAGKVTATAPPPKPQGPEVKFGSFESDEPTLAEKMGYERHGGASRAVKLHDSFHDPKHHSHSVRHLRGTGTTHSSTHVFHGKMSNGAEYIAKPHESVMEAGFDREDIEALHNATFGFLSMAGAHHMASAGLTHKSDAPSTFHGESKHPETGKTLYRLRGNHPEPEDSDYEHDKHLTIAAYHSGKRAHVQEFIPGAVDVRRAALEDPGKLDAIDGHHRMLGMIAHVLFDNFEGGHNVMVANGHPVLIDHDLSLESDYNKRYSELDASGEKTVRSIRSVFSPGSALDYTKHYPDGVGTDFPPEVQKALDFIARDGFSDPDGEHGHLAKKPKHAEALKRNAKLLALHGLEGAMERKNVHKPGQAIEVPSRLPDLPQE